MTIGTAFTNPHSHTTRREVEHGGTGHCDADHCALWWDGRCALASGWGPAPLYAAAVDRSAGCEAYEPWGGPEAA